jgi:hypothetical protein
MTTRTKAARASGNASWRSRLSRVSIAEPRLTAQPPHVRRAQEMDCSGVAPLPDAQTPGYADVAAKESDRQTLVVPDVSVVVFRRR